MRRFKVIIFIALALPSTALMAAGMGLHVPISLHSTAVVDNDIYRSDTEEYDTDDVEYKTSFGKGITFDSNIGQNRIYNYRLSLETIRLKIDKINGKTCQGECTSTRYNMVHTFGFGAIRNRDFRLWLGPRLNIAINEENGNSTNRQDDDVSSYVEIGLAAALGANFNINRAFAIAVDIDYRTSLATVILEEDDDNDRDESVEGATIRVYALFRFGERF